MTSWYKLDNIGHMYASITSDYWSGVFRLSVVLKSSVKRDLLQQSLDRLQNQLPYFFTTLKKGFFWNYLERYEKRLILQKDDDYPCRMLQPFGNHLIRVLYSEYRISLEIFHGLTDGNGGWLFFDRLLRQYFELCGYNINNNSYINDNITRDIYHNYQNVKNKIHKHKYDKAYQIKYYQNNRKMHNDSRYYLTHFVVNTDSIKVLSKQYDTTIGVVLTSIIANALYLVKCGSYINRDINSRRNIVINTSIDLKKKYKLNSVKNGFICKYTRLTNRVHSFDSILKEVKNEFESINDTYVNETINNNLKIQEHFLGKITPRFIKDVIINKFYHVTGERLATISLSNYGVIDTIGYSSLIYSLESSNGVAKVGRSIEASAVSFDNKTTITICCKYLDSRLERSVYNVIANIGLSFNVYSNVAVCTFCGTKQEVYTNNCCYCKAMLSFQNERLEYCKERQLVYIKKSYNIKSKILSKTTLSFIILFLLAYLICTKFMITTVYILPCCCMAVCVIMFVTLITSRYVGSFYYIILSFIFVVLLFFVNGLLRYVGVLDEVSLWINFFAVVVHILTIIIVIIFMHKNLLGLIKSKFYI